MLTEVSRGMLHLSTRYSPFRSLESFLRVTELSTLNKQDSIGATLLFWAAAGGHTETVKMLLNYGADPNVRTFGKQFCGLCTNYSLAGETPLHAAAKLQDSHLEMILALKEKNADPNATTVFGDTPLDYANPSSKIFSHLGAELKTGTKLNMNLSFMYFLDPLYHIGQLHFTQRRCTDFQKKCTGEFEDVAWSQIEQRKDEILARAPQSIIDYNARLTQEDIPDGIAYQLKALKNTIGYNRNEHKGLCYFSADVSPIEVWSLAYERFFYIPTFIIAKMDTPRGVPGRVIFEVDLSKFSEFSTKLDDFNVILSCYNIYDYQNIRPHGDQVIVRLQVADYHKFPTCDSVIDTERDRTIQESSTTFTQLLDRSLTYVKANLDAAAFFQAYKDLMTSFPFQRAPKPQRDAPRSMTCGIDDETGVVNILFALKFPKEKIAELYSAGHRPKASDDLLHVMSHLDSRSLQLAF